MKVFARILQYAVTALCAVFIAAAVPARAATLDELFAELAQPGNPEWQRVESDILREWSKSGSPTMDLLLKRGEDAIEAGDFAVAIEHLTALTDHAPDFPEGWNARATAYFLSGYLGPSLADIQHTLALEPRHFGALAGLGMILEEMENEEAALKAYRAARAIHPNRADLEGAVMRLERALQGTDI